MKTLDLHGVRHHQADEAVRKFLNYVDLPCEIIVGNSQKMKNIVKLVVDEYGWKFYEKDSYNYGALIIVEGSYE